MGRTSIRKRALGGFVVTTGAGRRILTRTKTRANQVAAVSRRIQKKRNILKAERTRRIRRVRRRFRR